MEVPDWFRRAKFGIFIHWGLYSVPAFSNEWYSRKMYEQGTPEYQHHLETYGLHKEDVDKRQRARYQEKMRRIAPLNNATARTV